MLYRDEVSLLANQSRVKPSLQLCNGSVGWGGKDGYPHFHQQWAHKNLFFFPMKLSYKKKGEQGNRAGSCNQTLLTEK